MKKYSIILFSALVVVACTSKVAPTASKTTETKTASTEKSAEAKAAIAAGHTIYTTKCSKCHGTKEVTAYDAKSWDGILKNMIPKAKLNEEEAKNVTAYVMANAKK